MKQFMGLIPLQVGISTLSATFIMLAVTMVSVNMWSIYNGTNIKACLVLFCLICLILVTWITAYVGSYESSLYLMSKAVIFWRLFLVIWLGLTVYSLFFTTDEEMHGGFTCLKNRCVPSCFILKYKLLKKDDLDKTTTETTEATETNIETTTEKTKRRNIKHKKGNLKGIKKKNGGWISNKSVEWADDKTKSDENTIENVVENVYETRIESINNDYRDTNVTTEVIVDLDELLNNTRLKRKSTNYNISNNDDFYVRYPPINVPKTPLDLNSLKYIIVVVSGSMWEIIVIPLIFFVLFMYAKSKLNAYIIELEDNMEFQSDNTCI